jgi:hypothetical protein
MRYRDARLLQAGEMVIRKSDRMLLTVQSIEAYGQHKKVKINCILLANQDGCEYVAGTTIVSLFNDEVE